MFQIGRILIDNAIVHTAAGSRILVTTESDPRSARFVVTDDGAGIPPEARQQIFERFYRLDGTVASGSGLGLAIARELAELMGGGIEVDSMPGYTRFALVLRAEAGDRGREPAPGSVVRNTLEREVPMCRAYSHKHAVALRGFS